MPDEDRIRQMVRRVVYRTLGLPQSSRPVAVRPLVTEADIQAAPLGGQLSIPQGALITPLARQMALERHVSLVETVNAEAAPAPSSAGAPRTGSSSASTDERIVAIGTDHGGYDLKEMLKGYLSELGYQVVRGGASSWTVPALVRVWRPTKCQVCAPLCATTRLRHLTVASTTMPTY